LLISPLPAGKFWQDISNEAASIALIASIASIALIARIARIASIERIASIASIARIARIASIACIASIAFYIIPTSLRIIHAIMRVNDVWVSDSVVK
jgi:hypothetical protein